MARRRRRRRFGDYVSVPLGLGKIKLPSVKGLNPLGKSVNSTDVLVGAFVGLGGGAIIKMGIAKFWPTAPAVIQNNIGPISTLGAGVAAQMLLKNKHKGTGYFVGAALAGLVPLGWGLLQRQFPQFFSDYVNIPVGMLTDVGPMGLLVDEGSSRLSELAAYSMGSDDDYSYVP
ncbi:MAG TPA: hypothetical protein VLV48_09830 [Thermoanaerobaculia bacterium]|nr:hypothetical protein [Thermoanaerobaculia bacterium]